MYVNIWILNINFVMLFNLDLNFFVEIHDFFAHVHDFVHKFTHMCMTNDKKTCYFFCIGKKNLDFRFKYVKFYNFFRDGVFFSNSK